MEHFYSFFSEYMFEHLYYSSFICYVLFAFQCQNSAHVRSSIYFILALFMLMVRLVIGPFLKNAFGKKNCIHNKKKSFNVAPPVAKFISKPFKINQRSFFQQKKQQHYTECERADMAFHNVKMQFFIRYLLCPRYTNIRACSFFQCSCNFQLYIMVYSI